MVDAEVASSWVSLNLDPRSGRLNTEMGVVLESPEALARALRKGFRGGALLDAAYRVEDRRGDGLAWITREQGPRSAPRFGRPRDGIRGPRVDAGA